MYKMGYDITLISLYDIAQFLKNGKSINDIQDNVFDEQELTYLSYNFSKFSEIWFARNSFGKTTEEFANDLRKASEKLNEQKVSAEIPKGFYETTKKKQVPYDDWTPDIRVFHWHIKRLLKICEDKPGCLVLADIGHSIKITKKDLQNCDEIKVKEQLKATL
jgi:hypothetical protein